MAILLLLGEFVLGNARNGWTCLAEGDHGLQGVALEGDGGHHVVLHTGLLSCHSSG
jgi:hypothetical protein